LVLGRQAADRLTVAKKVLRDFITGRPHDRLGVVAFGEEAFTFVPLTLDHGTLLEVLDSLQIGIAGANGTAVGQAIAVGAKRLKELEAPSRVLILLTDGRNNAGRIQPMEAAQAAAALDIRLYTIGVGAPVGGMRRMLGAEGVDEEGLQAIAELTGGRYFRATSTAALEEIYATIDELEPSTAEVRQLVSHTELYRWWLFPGVALVLGGWLLRSTLLRRLP
jgi:Ca-activated chloride channel family protein